MDRLEQAIHSLYNPTDQGIDLAAQKYCEAVKCSASSWRILVKLFATETSSLEARFWALQSAMEIIGKINQTERSELRTCLLQFVCTVAENNLDQGLETKLCLLYVRLIQCDYFSDPNYWESAFEDLLKTGSISMFGREFCLRVLKTFDEEVASEEYHRSTAERERNTIIKDAVRDHDAGRIIDFLKRVLDSDVPSHLVLSLSSLSQFVVWMDIHLIANREILERVYELLQSSDSSVASAAWDPLTAIVYKRMDSAQKISMINDMKLTTPVLQGSGPLKDAISHDKRGPTFICVISLQLLTCFVTLRSEGSKDPQNAQKATALAVQAWRLLSELLMPVTEMLVKVPHFPTCLEPFLSEFASRVRHCISNPLPIYDVSNSGMDILKSSILLAEERTSKNLSKTSGSMVTIPVEEVRPFVQVMLRILLYFIEYPGSFTSFDEKECTPTNEEISFLEFRESMSKLYKKFILVDEVVALDWLRMIVHQLVENVDKVTFRQVHAVLYLVFLTGEQVREISAVVKHPEHPLTRILTTLFSSAVLFKSHVEQCSHPIVRCCILDICVRYSSFLVQSQTHMPTCLDGLLLQRGLMDPTNRMVVCKAITALVKLSKQHPVLLASYLGSQWIELISPMLVIQLDYSAGSAPLSSKTMETQKYSKGCLLSTKVGNYLFTQDEQMYLFESLGFLAGPQHNSAFCRLILQPLTLPLTDLSSLNTIVTSHPVAGGVWLSRHLQAMASFSKGFSTNNACKEEWLEALKIVLRASKIFFLDYRTRGSALFFCHRMVHVIGGGTLPSLVELLQAFYDASALPPSHLGNHEIEQCAKLYMHLLGAFKGSGASEPLYPLLPTIFERHLLLWATTPSTSAFYTAEKEKLQQSLCNILASAGKTNPILLASFCAQGSTPFQGVCSPSLSQFMARLGAIPEDDADFEVSSKMLRITENTGYYATHFLLASCAETTPILTIVFALQAFGYVFKYALESAESQTNPQLLETFLIVQVVQAIGHLIMVAKTADAEWTKVFQEICQLCRILCKTPNVPQMTQLGLRNIIHASFSESLRTEGEIISLLLQKIIDHEDLQESRDVLWRWKLSCCGT